jgi:hypothetical protein
MINIEAQVVAAGHAGHSKLKIKLSIYFQSFVVFLSSKSSTY